MLLLGLALLFWKLSFLSDLVSGGRLQKVSPEEKFVKGAPPPPPPPAWCRGLGSRLDSGRPPLCRSHRWRAPGAHDMGLRDVSSEPDLVA